MWWIYNVFNILFTYFLLKMGLQPYLNNKLQFVIFFQNIVKLHHKTTDIIRILREVGFLYCWMNYLCLTNQLLWFIFMVLLIHRFLLRQYVVVIAKNIFVTFAIWSLYVGTTTGTYICKLGRGYKIGLTILVLKDNEDDIQRII